MDDAAIPDGYYAVHDPADHGRVLYWRHTSTGRCAGLKPWPAKATYGPVLFTKDIPEGLAGGERAAWVRNWFATVRQPWDTAVREAIAADIEGAARRFAELCVRCCCCGRALGDTYSKVVGIGPECRRGAAAESLAAVLTPKVGSAHAAFLAEDGGSRG